MQIIYNLNTKHYFFTLSLSLSLSLSLAQYKGSQFYISMWFENENCKNPPPLGWYQIPVRSESKLADTAQTQWLQEL